MTKKKQSKPIEPVADSASIDTEMQQQLAELQQLAQTYEDKWKRAVADYQNLEKRIENHQSQMIRLAGANLIRSLLSAIDDLHRAANHIQDAGLNMVIKQFEEVLKQEGLEEIDTHNQVFDPNAMECLDLVDGPKDQVIDTRQKGYRYYGSVLRPAKVTVGKGEA